MEYFETYKHQYMFSFIPVDIIPYTQSISWERREAKEHSQVDTWGSRQITIAKFVTTYTENVKTCGGSFVDTVTTGNPDNLKPTCAYDPATETNYEDSHWKWEPLADQGYSWYG